MTLGERLKKIREEKNLLQEDTAKFLKVTQKTISNYEKGERRPDPDTLKRLSEFYGVSSDFLLGKTDLKNIDSSPLDEFISYFENLSEEDQDEAVKRLINKAIGRNKKGHER